jgi:hypothetical protein
MQPNEPCRRSKIILSRASAPPTKTFHFTCEITFYPKPSRPSISFGPPASTLDSQREEHLNRTFDFNCTPLAPLGTKVIIHEKPSKRRSWAPHGLNGWYVGHAPEHYRCYKIFVTATAAARVSDTVEFFPRVCQMPRTSSTDAAKQAAHDLIHALLHPKPAAPFAQLGDQQTQALQQLARINDAAINNNPPSNKIAPRQLPRVDRSPPRVAAPRLAQGPSAPCPAPRVATRRYSTWSTERPHRYSTRSTGPPPHRAYHVASVTQAALPLTAPTTNAEPPVPKHFAYSVIDPTSGIVQEYKQLSKDPATSKL